jgi:parallel beta-helix repeat protein
MKEKRINIKLFLTVFILLFISISYTVNSTDIEKSWVNGKTLYVGGSGPGNYSSIKAAVNDATDGDTIFVYSGKYVECVRTTKSIELHGEDKHTTIIDSNGNGHTVNVDNANNFKIHGFKIVSSQQKFDVGISIFKSNNVHIYDNIIEGFHKYGISILGGFGCVIENNEITGSVGLGSKITYTFNVNFKNNIIEASEIGMLITGRGQHKITNNKISARDKGIWIELARFHKIINNEIYGCKKGLYLSHTQLIVFKENNFLNNDVNARFNDYFPISSLPDIYQSNYWDDWSGSGPYIVNGIMELPQFYTPYEGKKISWNNYDWFPASEPYTV